MRLLLKITSVFILTWLIVIHSYAQTPTIVPGTSAASSLLTEQDDPDFDLEENNLDQDFTVGTDADRPFYRDVYSPSIIENRTIRRAIQHASNIEMFDRNSHEIRTSGASSLNRMAKAVSKLNGFKLVIISDAYQRTNGYYDRSLAMKRSEAVYEFLANHGIPKNRLIIKHFNNGSSAAYAEDFSHQRVQFLIALD